MTHIAELDLPTPHLEIERKFVLASLPVGYDQLPYCDIEQGYVLSGADGSLRVRKSVTPAGEATHYMTVKQGEGLTRTEVEIEIGEQAFSDFWSMTKGNRIMKRRYEVAIEDGTVVTVDQYRGALGGLIVGEIEFDTLEHANNYIAPTWLTHEVTGNAHYSNEHLALYGIPKTPDKTQQTPDVVISPDLQKDIERLFALIDSRLNPNSPVVVFAAGRTSAGKSSAITEQIKQQYGASNVLVFAMDDYFGGNTYMEKMKRNVPDINWDHPAYLRFDLVIDDLIALLDGEQVDKPIFNFKTGEPDTRTETISAEGKRIIIVEGIHALHEDLDGFGGIRAFVDISLHGSIIRRLLRDMSRTSMDPAAILRYYVNTVEPMYQQYVAPRVSRADIVLTNEYDPGNESNRAPASEHQIKFATSITRQEVGKVAQRIQSTHQVDYYFEPRDGLMRDEVFRIRAENGNFILTYKGPQTTANGLRTRRILEFALDETTARTLIDNQEYGPLIKVIKKDREIFLRNGLVFSVDDVTLVDSYGTKSLGRFVEVRFEDNRQNHLSADIADIVQALGITSEPNTTPYSQMNPDITEA